MNNPRCAVPCLAVIRTGCLDLAFHWLSWFAPIWKLLIEPDFQLVEPIRFNRLHVHSAIDAHPTISFRGRDHFATATWASAPYIEQVQLRATFLQLAA